MIYLKLVVLLLQIAQSLIRWMNEKQLISEGERRVIAKQLAATAAAAQLSKDVRADVANKTADEIDDALRGDFRP